MNLALSDEQVFLREAARGALSRFKTLEAAREALDGDEQALPDLWPTACEAGWPGLLIAEEHGGAGLDAFDAMLVLGECGRVIAGVPLLGHLPATAILDASAGEKPMIDELATGEKRAAYLPVSPPGDVARAGPSTRRAGSSAARSAGARAAGPSAARCTSSPTRPAPTCWSAWRSTATRPSAWRSTPGRRASRSRRSSATTRPARSAT